MTQFAKGFGICHLIRDLAPFFQDTSNLPTVPSATPQSWLDAPQDLGV